MSFGWYCPQLAVPPPLQVADDVAEVWATNNGLEFFSISSVSEQGFSSMHALQHPCNPSHGPTG